MTAHATEEHVTSAVMSHNNRTAVGSSVATWSGMRRTVLLQWNTWYHDTNNKRGTVFSVGPAPRLYHSINCVEFSQCSGVELRIRQSEASSGATVRKATASKDVKPWTRKLRDLRHWKPVPGDNQWRSSKQSRHTACCSDLQSVWISDSTAVTCSYYL
jgi:hypothetical protein